MASDHIEMMELLKAYLLDELPHENAEAVELRYFQDRAFFHRVQAAESALVEDYVGGRLAGARRERFEARYLARPDLRVQVDKARRAREAISDPVRLSLRWQSMTAALAAMLMLVAAGVWVSRRGNGPAPTTSHPSVPPVAATVLVSLSPGLVKGSQSTTGFSIPPARGTVRFVLELPGRNKSLDYSVRVSLVDADGQWRRVWEGTNPVRSVASGNSQSLRLDVDSTVFNIGDYVLQVTSGGQVQETYVFRAN